MISGKINSINEIYMRALVYEYLELKRMKGCTSNKPLNELIMFLDTLFIGIEEHTSKKNILLAFCRSRLSWFNGILLLFKSQKHTESHFWWRMRTPKENWVLHNCCCNHDLMETSGSYSILLVSCRVPRERELPAAASYTIVSLSSLLALIFSSSFASDTSVGDSVAWHVMEHIKIKYSK